MIERRPFASLGGANHGWLDAKHHFSFAEYQDNKRMNWGAMRVWNDDIIQPGTGFPPHPHREMEIITYVRQGAITHQDSLGNTGRTEAGDVQVMSAGSGVRGSMPSRPASSPSWLSSSTLWICSALTGRLAPVPTHELTMSPRPPCWNFSNTNVFPHTNLSRVVIRPSSGSCAICIFFFLRCNIIKTFSPKKITPLFLPITLGNSYRITQL